MTTDRKLKIIFGILSVGLLITLLFKLNKVPGGMILSGLFLGVMYLIGIIIVCLILSVILNFIFKKISFSTIFFILTTLSFLAFHYQIYSPTLKIKVPNGYSGEVNLVLSNVKNNILTVDSNGIGYITAWTFNKTYSKPIVEQMDGKNLDKNLVGFNNLSFFGQSIGDGNTIKSLSFEIVPENQKEKKYYNWMDKVDKKLILLEDTNKRISNQDTVELKSNQ